ncbi:MAG: TspO/MBR family protein, partial [Xanthomonadales bacterium]
MIARYASMAGFLTLVVFAAAIGGGFEAGEWYYSMNKPAWTPPPWFFAPLWAVLYVMMALAAWQVWLTGHYSRLGALIWWMIQLLLNVAWSWLFFDLHRLGWAWLELGLLIGVVVLCIRAFHLLSKSAAYLMMPYLVWLIFSWVLNLATWTM